MALHKFLIEHAIWPAMEKRKGNKIREIQRALEKVSMRMWQRCSASG